jgi:ABC-type lipoprotein export system ATPase subunit
MVEIKNVSKKYINNNEIVNALSNITLNFDKIGLVFIIGKSGSGKSTLLNLIGGLDQNYNGNIESCGTLISSLSENNLNSYRNTCIGFIFQEFNLFENQSVFDNIAISGALQNSKNDNEKILEIIKFIGLTGKEKRKPNELSGGQKQRVAIGRAIAKDSKIILADEPTGSLDSNTAKSIFDLLKEISDTKLVIVVSHDELNAKKYADRIIKIDDGKIISDSKETVNTTIQKKKIKKSSLSTFRAIKFALNNFKKKKMRISIILFFLILTLLLFNLSNSISKFDINKAHAKTIIDNNSYIKIKKILSMNNLTGKYYDYGSRFNFNDSDIDNLSKVVNSDLMVGYELTHNGSSVGLNTNCESYNNFDIPIYYYCFKEEYKFIELSKKQFNEMKIIGKIAVDSDEMVIHKYVADLIITRGILLNNNNFYKPDNYHTIINDNITVNIGNTQAKIVGIIDDDLSEFEELKKVTMNKIVNDNSKILPSNINLKAIYFNYNVQETAQNIYVPNSFLNSVKLEKDNDLNLLKMNLKIRYNLTDYIYSDKAGILSDSISIISLDGIKEINNLKDNEIIINNSFLNLISNGEFSKNLSSINKQEISEQLFISKYLEDNNILDSSISTKISPYEPNEESKEYVFKDLKIIGFSYDINKLYFSSQILNDILDKNLERTLVIFKGKDLNSIESVLNSYKPGESKYKIYSGYSVAIDLMSDKIGTIILIARYLGILTSLISFLLLVSYIINSLVTNKKELGILRALGASKMDILKISAVEGHIIAFFALIAASLLNVCVIKYVNFIIIKRIYYPINFLSYNIYELIWSIIITFLISSLATLFVIKRITKLSPNDIINNN